MSVSAVEQAPAYADPHHLRAAEHDGPAPKRIVTGYGFWIFLLSDIVMFSCFFASFAVLSKATAGGPGGAELFDIRNVAIETALLLVSSFACGMASIAAERHSALWFQVAMAATGLLGAGFLLLEAREFTDLVGRGDGPSRSAFLSAFFTLVGTHGLHVSCGLIWLVTLMVQVQKFGLIEANRRRLMCLSMFWHFLDVVWIGVFTFVYLLGVLR